ncbi:MAG: coproporphyrinogen III oxidase [Alphaproteobacteria bacterium]|nr:MAG: coproporphyrinogen III oxidase [Alphaproteobacteria bacterium]
MTTVSSPGFGIYVHWPFCLAKCPYCDFNSHVVRDIDQRAWAEALCKELRTLSDRQDTREVTSIFFGGGTPSLMAGETVATVLDEISSLWSIASDVEITLEANPTSVEAERFKAYRAAGVNRLSLGVQSLVPEDLKNLGRLHTVDEALGAVQLAREIFPRLSFDLIYARPGQSEAAWEAELEKALSFAADHLSLYQLTIEPGTPFQMLFDKGALTLPEEEVARRLYEMTEHLCNEAGLAAYEVSNYAKPGAEGRHNLTYWRYGDYMGVGPGAHGRLSQGGKRFATETELLPAKWMEAVNRQGQGLVEECEIPPEIQAQEYLLMGLRLREGISKDRAGALAGTPLNWGALQDLETEGLIEQDENTLAATTEGRLVLNTLISEVVRRLF